MDPNKHEPTSEVEVDDDLIRKAMQLGGHKTEIEAATAALKEYIEYHRTNNPEQHQE